MSRSNADEMGPVMLGEAAKSFASTMWHARQNRASFSAWQSRRLSQWLRTAVPRVSAYAGPVHRITDLPITDKTMLMSDFAAYNTAGITADQAWNALAKGQQINDLIIGASTGTTGNRGLFVVSEREQFRWLGTILAKTIPDLLWHPQRVAIILPRGTALYDSANRTRRLALRFFDITQGVASWTDQLCAFDPTVIVAPPRILRHFAEADFPLNPTRVFSAAETLDPVDATIIRVRFGTLLRQIYMATEGLFAVSCHLGNLHLAEDSVFFEYEPVGDGLVSPLVTCFRRETQIMARYRMNDLLRLARDPCPCGSPLQHVTEVAGRRDDAFEINEILITPDVLRDAVVQADASINDFRIVQTGPCAVTLTLPLNCADDVMERALVALDRVFQSRQISVALTARRAVLTFDPKAKLRRVRTEWPA
jgi:phenylacetate-CoA ligase